MPDIFIVVVVIVALLGLYLLAWHRHSRRYSPGHWFGYRRWMFRFNTLGDGRRRSAHRDRDAGHDPEGPRRERVISVDTRRRPPP